MNVKSEELAKYYKQELFSLPRGANSRPPDAAGKKHFTPGERHKTGQQQTWVSRISRIAPKQLSDILIC
jgi:hypothetical protein